MRQESSIYREAVKPKNATVAQESTIGDGGPCCAGIKPKQSKSTQRLDRKLRFLDGERIRVQGEKDLPQKASVPPSALRTESLSGAGAVVLDKAYAGCKSGLDIVKGGFAWRYRSMINRAIRCSSAVRASRSEDSESI